MRTAYAIAIAGSLLAGAPALAADIDWTKVDQAFGKKGADQPGDIHKYGLPRSDLHVTLDGGPSSRPLRSVAGSPSSRWATPRW